ncbi:POU domain, class 4, transcription factor 3 isoform X2 [Eurytemora carolleeae]|uniref:POU domain, class 4, transcription factor 3 isoform X2 n=1 Tax=Eurytemora carolleeae TaxID=1294199 RepID=UPI000C759670|nr:POU domain, class 4, transcription factor 3 isoform X2 [Eurytemora carolleeae]|eukprot:XP_023342551.1 POU domain, class 4, transcription factor 3-like isoform X2 [Eurytemora affinis]
MMMTSWAEMKMGGKPLGPPISSSNCFSGRYSPTYRVPEHSMRRCVANSADSMIFSGLNNELLSREGLVALDMKHPVSPGPLTPSGTPLSHHSLRDSVNLTPGPLPHIKQDMMYPQMSSPGPPPSRQWYQEACLGVSRWTEKQKNVMDVHDMSLDMLGGGGMSGLSGSMGDCVTSSHGIHPSMSMYQLEKNCSALDMFQTHSGMMSPHNPLHHPHHPHHVMPMSDADTDPRELEAFAERFKQRRIKLGVTQCDVGKALANLKLPGVGALSQSTICRFESLTLSHNNMIALKPVLMAWLDEAEAASMLAHGEKKRKRTSIAAPEKRSLEAYFAVQPRPSGEKIAAIAEKLDLKKNVVRVWFCNQRQKQKRMKFAAQSGIH